MATTHRKLEVGSNDWGLTFQGHFRHGSQGIIARYDAPTLRFPADTPLHIMRDTVEAWNQRLQATFSGAGYYASCPMADSAPGKGDSFILFASNDFFSDFMSSAVAESLFTGKRSGTSGHE